MTFIYILTLAEIYQNPKNWTPDTNEILDKHFNYLEEKFDQGILKHVGRTELAFDDPNMHGYVVFEEYDEDLARVLIENDPAVLSGVMTAILLPYKLLFSN